ncbi:YIP1 family protein [Halobaculum gomorrense]|uniref:Yip1 domain-containing protein n=1 Tax=Halobaculum gomorrense TaxID=43928 RepID=A0A1M5Q7T8_9EURY|nr:YIP1 family protein [Halobaculum gomorrense]SHH09990.1 Yip1 domain-containing protein [Halobaculum gomorrense]
MVLGGPLVRPDESFDRDPGSYSVERALGLVAALALLSALSVVVIGAGVAHAIPDEATVENPERPPASACDDESTVNLTVDGEPVTFATPETCDEPARVPTDRLVWRAVGGELPGQFFAPMLGWLLVGGVFHAVTRSDGESPAGPMTVAAWGRVSRVLGTLLLALVLAWTAAGSGVAPGTPTAEATIRTIGWAFEASVPLAIGVRTAAIGWGAWIEYHGLRRVRDLPPRRALLVVGLVAGVSLVVSLWALLSVG